MRLRPSAYERRPFKTADFFREVEVETLKHLSPPTMRGSIPWGWLLAIVIIAVIAALAVVFFPKPTAKAPPPAVVRAKVPQMAPEPAPRPDQAAVGEQRQPMRDEATETDADATTLQESDSTLQQETAPSPAAATGSPVAASDQSDSRETQTPEQTTTSPATVVSVVQTSDNSASATPQTPSKTTVSSPTDTPGDTSTPSPTSAKAQDAKAQDTPQESESAASTVAQVRAETPRTNQAREEMVVPKGYAIQVGAYRNKTYAEAQMEELNERGYNAHIYEVTDAQQRSFYMVRFGNFAKRQRAAETVADFRKKEKIEAVIVRAGAM